MPGLILLADRETIVHHTPHGPVRLRKYAPRGEERGFVRAAVPARERSDDGEGRAALATLRPAASGQQRWPRSRSPAWSPPRRSTLPRPGRRRPRARHPRWPGRHCPDRAPGRAPRPPVRPRGRGGCRRPRGHPDLHARRKGEDCTDPDCATRRRKAARRRATSYGITGPSVSALLGAAGFEARTHRNPGGGFATEGDPKQRCVWLHTGRQDTDRMTTALTGRGLVVTPGPGGPGSGVLRILARAEAERQGIDLPAPATTPAPALPSTAGIRAALRRAGLPLATDRDGAPDAGSGLDVSRGRPGQWVVGWSAGHDRDGGDAWRARNARRAEMTAAAAEALRAGYTLEVEQREGWTPRITVTGRRPALT